MNNILTVLTLRIVVSSLGLGCAVADAATMQSEYAGSVIEIDDQNHLVTGAAASFPFTYTFLWDSALAAGANVPASVLSAAFKTGTFDLQAASFSSHVETRSAIFYDSSLSGIDSNSVDFSLFVSLTNNFAVTGNVFPVLPFDTALVLIAGIDFGSSFATLNYAGGPGQGGALVRLSVDKLTVTNLTPDVPLPATLPLFASGICAIGLVARRKAMRKLKSSLLPKFARMVFE